MHFVRKVVGVPVVSKEIVEPAHRRLSGTGWKPTPTTITPRSSGPRRASAREDHDCSPGYARMANKNAYGVYFIFKSMEQRPSFRISVPKYPTPGPASPHPRPPTHPAATTTTSTSAMRSSRSDGDACGLVLPRFQTTYYLNGHSFIEQELTRAQVGFRKERQRLPGDRQCRCVASGRRQGQAQFDIIRKRLDYWTLIPGTEILRQGAQAAQPVALLCHLPDRVLPQLRFQAHLTFPFTNCSSAAAGAPGLWRLTARQDCLDLRNPPEPQDAGQARHLPSSIRSSMAIMSFAPISSTHFLKQYEKFSTFLRNELCSNNLTDFGLRKELGPSLMRSAGRFKPSPAVRGLPGTVAQCPRRIPAHSALPSPSPSARSDIREPKSMTCA